MVVVAGTDVAGLDSTALVLRRPVVGEGEVGEQRESAPEVGDGPARALGVVPA